jgi:hypothetical protein
LFIGYCVNETIPAAKMAIRRRAIARVVAGRMTRD